ncbi:hypothetical protein LCGC14_0118580 [marine sediment metagenome]|uniref:TM2 domain-containing protein n=1 Tax=marine sediment metagenome TaxID=412755 RepID=A0A0F9V7R9_9ZZZZ|nr:TM2 domain-containing protein [Maribacter sp.]HDZ07365.1 TM2 domain-containing protein [Maribacter sp.]HEA81723.1 TM2 domain-containing protein [Maribacter sp.]
MSDENKDLGDKAEDAFDNTKESAKDFSEGAKKTANEFTAGAREAFSGGGQENKKVLVGILAIVLGSLGVHKFILGYQKEGFILLGASVIGYITVCFVIGGFILTATAVIGLIEGIIYLTKSDEEFYNTYQVGRKPWF